MINHNIETVERLHPLVRPSARYAPLARAAAAREASCGGGDQDQVRDHARAWASRTTSSRPTLADLVAHGCDLLTIGQYLRPDARITCR